MGKIMSISIMVLFAWGFVFMLLKTIGLIHWPWVWVMSPVFAAVVIYVILVILAVALGIEI